MYESRSMLKDGACHIGGTLGNISGGCGTHRLPRLVGLGQAVELIFLVEMIKAGKVESIRLDNRIIPFDCQENVV